MKTTNSIKTSLGFDDNSALGALSVSQDESSRTSSKPIIIKSAYDLPHPPIFSAPYALSVSQDKPSDTSPKTYIFKSANDLPHPPIFMEKPATKLPVADAPPLHDVDSDSVPHLKLYPSYIVDAPPYTIPAQPEPALRVANEARPPITSAETIARGELIHDLPNPILRVPVGDLLKPQSDQPEAQHAQPIKAEHVIDLSDHAIDQLLADNFGSSPETVHAVPQGVPLDVFTQIIVVAESPVGEGIV